MQKSNQTKIPEHLYPYFESAGYRKQYLPDEVIYLQGESADQLYVIVSGRVRAYYIDINGRELTFEIIEKGRIFGESSFLSYCVNPVSISAVNEVELIVCDMQQLYQCMEESRELSSLIIQLLSSTCNHLSEQLRRITLYDRYQKIASFLLYETAFPNEDRGVSRDSIPYTQEELALCLGLNRVTVNRVLREWKQKDIIASSYGNIRILNRSYLQNLLHNRTCYASL